MSSAGHDTPPNADDYAAIDHIIVPRTRDIGGFEVRRVLPSTKTRMVGPFVFFDQMGPDTFPSGEGLDVRPHPHIGLATVTYLFDGEILHRDSLGVVQAIRPGEVNWMTAGRGIAHSERTDEDQRPAGPRLYGIQAWVALPKTFEETDPGFSHHGAGDQPIIEDTDKRVRVIAGSAWGKTAQVKTFSDMFYADADLSTGAKLPIPTEYEERALYIADGRISVNGDSFGSGQLLVLHPGDAITVEAENKARVMVLGGEPMDGPRHIWWNFVSSSKDRIEQAKADWLAGRFDAVPNESEFIPLPDS
jgi:hypothetical protein